MMAATVATTTTNVLTTPVSPKSQGCKLVIVEGNISAGKSTLCRSLADELGYVLYLEPTVENPFLTKYYKEPKVYALPMQLWLLKQRFVTYLRAVKYSLVNPDCTQGVILDRSIWSDVVFAEKNMLDGNISKAGYEYYMELRKKLLTSLPVPHVVVYLDASPQVCFDRIHKMRQRACEDGIPLEYLAGLDKCYRNFMEEMETTVAACLNVKWDTFGDARHIVEHIEKARSPPLAKWATNHKELVALVNSASKVAAAMQMSYTIAEAEGADVEVADPDFITAKEVRIMPSRSTVKLMTSASGSKRVMATKRSSPDSDDESVEDSPAPTKIKRTQLHMESNAATASPTSVAHTV